MKAFWILASLILLTASSVNAVCNENWQCSAWQKCAEGITSRSCFDLNGCSSYENMPALSGSCNEVFLHCYDQILNYDETDTDCGGDECEGCGLGKNCFSNNDCSLADCINNQCLIEQRVKPAPAVNASWLMAIIIILLSASIIAVLFLLMKKLRKSAQHFQHPANFQGISEPDASERLRKCLSFQWPFWKRVSKRLKKPITYISSKERRDKSIHMNNKKSRINRFTENLKGYLKLMNSEKPMKKDEPKGLLNKNSFKRQEHPVRQFMLGNLREVYDDEQ